MYSKIHKWLSILAFGSFVISVAVSASTRSFSSIRLHSRTIDTNRVSKEEYFQALGDDSPNSSDDDIGMHLVQLKSPLGPSQLKRFEKLYGISTLFYIPENAYIIRCTQSIAMGVAKSNEVHWIGPLLPKDKFSPDVQFPQEENPWQLSLHCIIMMHVVEDGRQLAKSIKEAFPFHIDDFSATPISKDRIEVCFKATSMLYATILDALSRRNEAIYLYRVPLRQKLNKFADRIIRNGNQRAALTPSAMSELSGAGQIIGCGDTGLDPDHCFFHDPTRPIPLVHYSGSDIPDDSSDPFHRKIVQYVSYTEQLVILDGHGTHVAGTLVGKPWDYNPDKLRDIDGYSGIAMDAKLAFFDISGKDVSNGVNIPKVLDSSYFGWAYAAGARIHSNSWGSPTVLYNVDAYDVDKYAWEHKDFLPVFAAGNNGTDGDKHVSSPGNAKNAISVGSSISPLQSFQEVFCEHGYSPNYFVCKQAHSEFQHLTENDIAYFSSMGPTVDGRIKPDVVAPGYYIYSARNAPDQAESCELEMSELLLAHAGTSMSAPVLASTLALARQYFVDGYYPTGDKKTGVQLHPSAALLKAVAIAGAVSLTGYRDYGSNLVHNYRPLTPAPTFVQGFGRTQLDNVLKFNGVSRFDMIIAGYKDGEDFKDPFFEDLGQFHEYKVCILGNSKKYRPRFTLVWTDYPAVPLSAVAIVNDLDLQVQYELRNSNVTQLSEPIHPNRSDHPDRVNTVERVELTEEPLSDVVIVRVSAASIHHAPQSYSLLITGQVAMVDMQESCRKVSHRKFAVDPLDADNIGNSKIATWHDRILSNMFLFGVLASTLTIVFMLMCFDICLRLKAKRQTKSRNEKSAPNEAMVLAGRNLSFP